MRIILISIIRQGFPQGCVHHLTLKKRIGSPQLRKTKRNADVLSVKTEVVSTISSADEPPCRLEISP
ncbi:hypothetical protein M5689_000238 [Euphorbia peplus]|nr:hypothetical protein M5689_000238 [Euphorbia peplus]